VGDELWLVNTAFGCLCTLDSRHSFVPRWRPPFLTVLACGRSQVRLGIEAAEEVVILREEIDNQWRVTERPVHRQSRTG
jgi:hypothetical protein